ncbi:MAG: trigger factor [Synergistaceae bacterium]|nr:trigger factor [Synergistaceae bacterium]
MRTELLGQEKNIVKIKLEIEASEFTKALNRALNELAMQINIPGFRKGKAPRKVLEMRFGRDAIYNEALEKLMPDEIRKIVEDYELEPIEAPSLNLTEKIEEGKNVFCELVFEVRPEVELPEIDGLEIEKVTGEVTDEAVDNLAKRIRIQLADIKPAERAIQDGDLVDLELTIKVINPDGTEAAEQPKPEPSHEKINLSDETIRPQVREALIGKSKGDEVSAEFDVEENHSDRPLAGKHVKYLMKIEGVSEYILPELNEQFYKDVFGQNTEIKDESAFRAKLREDITNEVNETSKTDLQNRAVELIASKSKVEIPEKFIARQVHSMRHDDEHWAKDNGLELKQVYALDTEEGRKGYEKLLRDRAEIAVKNVLVMDECAKKYDVRLEQEDLNAEFERRAKQLNVSKAFIAKFFNENQQQLDRLTDELRWNKIADVLISHMNVKEVKELSKPEANQENQSQSQEN